MKIKTVNDQLSTNFTERDLKQQSAENCPADESSALAPHVLTMIVDSKQAPDVQSKPIAKWIQGIWLDSCGSGRLKPWQAYLFALVATTATLGLRLALKAQVGGQSTMVIFTVPIMLSAYLGGLRAGLLATALSVLSASYYLLPPLYDFRVASEAEQWNLFFVVLAGIVISALNEALHRARRRANTATYEHQQAEERVRAALKETNDLRAALDEHAIVATTDPEGRITYVNDKFCTISKYSREELLGQDHRIIDSNYHPKEFIRDLWKAIARDQVWHGEIKNKAKDGTSYWVDTTIVPFLNKIGKPQQYVAICADITERKRAEQSIQESEEYFRFLNDLAKAIRVLADPAQIMAVTARMLGEHLHVSRCAYADVEKDSEQFTILHDYTNGCASTVGNYQLSLFGARVVTTLHDGQTLIIRDVEKELLPDEGANMFNAIGIKAIITCPLIKDGSLRAMMAVHQTTPRDWTPGEIAIVHDVVERCWATIERRTAEEKIRQLNTELEQRVIERTIQLETANKELEAFSYSISHDLRAPLRAVDGFSQAVLEDFGPKLPIEGQRQLQVIRESAQQMGQLIDDLLAFSRLSRQSLNKQTLNTETLVRAILEDMNAQQGDRQIQINIGNLPPCEGDSALLRQVWINLLSNAFKYSSKCKHAVIEIGAVEQNGTPVYFVRDNGSGFDMRYANKLFGVFQRLHRTEDYPGTGVGLAIVQRIVQRHGGHIWAEAAIDSGATFYFTLQGETKHEGH